MNNKTELQGTLKTESRFRCKINYIYCWNKWRKRSLNSPINKLLVLIGLIYSPTFFNVLAAEEIRKFQFIGGLMNKPYIIAVDFDGTLEDGACPSIGTPNMKLIHLLKILKLKGCELILWTCREGKELEEAVRWCESYDLHFDAINDNTGRAKERWGNNPRKVGADFYIDDRNCNYGELAELLCEMMR